MFLNHQCLVGLAVLLLVGCKLNVSHTSPVNTQFVGGTTVGGARTLSGKEYRFLISYPDSKKPGSEECGVFVQGDGILTVSVEDDIATVNGMGNIPVKRKYMTLLFFDGEIKEVKKLVELPVLPVNNIADDDYETYCIKLLTTKINNQIAR